MSAPALYFALVYSHASGRNKAVRGIQEYAAVVDGCLVSEDGIDRIIKARNAIAAAYSSTVGDVEVVELEDGLRRVRLCRGCTIIFRRVRRMI